MVYPCEATALAGCIEAAEAGLIAPVLVGPRQTICEVAGDADILVVPDLEAGNILAKLLTFLANADAAGLVLGARVPIILTSRADNVPARMASCGIALLVAHARRSGQVEVHP